MKPSNNRGGGIYINGSSNSHIYNSTITNSSYQGGGIYMISTGEISSSLIITVLVMMVLVFI